MTDRQQGNIICHEDGPVETHVKCSKYGMCVMNCRSPCNSKKAMAPEEMVEYGWPLEAAQKRQSGVIK